MIRQQYPESCLRSVLEKPVSVSVSESGWMQGMLVLSDLAGVLLNWVGQQGWAEELKRGLSSQPLRAKHH